MKVLFIGGTGIISSACSSLAVSRGIELYHLNRGESSRIRKIPGVRSLLADIRRPGEARKALAGHRFDVVVDWIAFEPAHIRTDLDLFSGITSQYVFISTASAYETPPAKLPVTEQTPLNNPFWEYSRQKIACEQMLREAYEREGFPFTIVRPSHTYDKTLLPLIGGYTACHRMMQGLPVVVHGDGTSLWTLTHHEDFAPGFVGLLGRTEAIGEDYHITSDEWLSWNSIYRILAAKLGKEAELVHVPSEVIAKYDENIGAGLLGDKAHSMIFDNSKIKALVPEFKAKIPFEQGAGEIIDWYAANPGFRQPDKRINALMDELIKNFRL